jgi:hypothetical protein
MRHEAQAVTDYGKEVLFEGVRSLMTPAPLNGLGGSVVELPLLVPGGEAAALEAAAEERGLTVGQLARFLFRDFLGKASGPGAPAVVIRTSYGRQSFKNKEEFISFQRCCAHPSAGWIPTGSYESFVCDRCWAVLDVGWPDYHPEICRWVNEGGAAIR